MSLSERPNGHWKPLLHHFFIFLTRLLQTGTYITCNRQGQKGSSSTASQQHGLVRCMLELTRNEPETRKVQSPLMMVVLPLTSAAFLCVCALRKTAVLCVGRCSHIAGMCTAVQAVINRCKPTVPRSRAVVICVRVDYRQRSVLNRLNGPLQETTP